MLAQFIHVFLDYFFFNDTATTEIYTLSLHDALPISAGTVGAARRSHRRWCAAWRSSRSEEHTSELQSRQYLVCRLLLEKINNKESEYDMSERISRDTDTPTLYVRP